jgi:hypothetical protein
MSRSIIIFILMTWLGAAAVFAQDPGTPDSIIIALVEVEPGLPSVMIPVYVVTDDPVASFVLPLEWTSLDGKINPGGAIYQRPLVQWDTIEDSVDVSNDHLLIWGTCDTGGPPNPVMNTGGQRQLVMLIRMVMHPGAQEQYVPLNPYVDLVRGPTVFGLDDGSNDFPPAVVPGGLVYGLTGIPQAASLPNDFGLEQNYPNPFNSYTEVNFSVPGPGFVTLAVYNILGKKVKTLMAKNLEAGYYSVRWDGSDETGENVSSGLYFYSLQSGDMKISRKMLLLK